MQFHVIHVYKFDSFGGTCSYVPLNTCLHNNIYFETSQHNFNKNTFVVWHIKRKFGSHLKLARQSWGQCIPHPLHKYLNFIIEVSKAGTLSEPLFNFT